MFIRHTFRHRRRNLRDLWNSSSDEEEKQQSLPSSNIEMIDLSESSIMCSTVSTTTTTTTTTTMNVSMLSTTNENSSSYIPYTLSMNSRRYSILPAFPSSFYEKRPPLLLANVPIHKLDKEQRARRQLGVYPSVYSINRECFDIPSYFRDYYQTFMNSLVYQFNVDEAILDYNLCRFSQCFQAFTDDFIRRHKYPAEQFVLNYQQKQYAFEFYLQIDVDLFYMKTCSFRQAKPRSSDEGLFCINEPDQQYGLTACNNCQLCVPRYNLHSREQLGPMIRFSSQYGFSFRNGYQTILNCPANCHTHNLIYVMVCPCGEYEYIGETSQRLLDRLRYHRKNLNRILHEFLIGERNVQLTRTHEKDQETMVKDRMLLYRHAARCPSAMQIFLNFNPIYWCFVPMPNREVEIENQRNISLPPTLILLDTVNPTSIGSKDRKAISATSKTRSDEAVRSFMRHLPPVPTGYSFTVQQRIKQFEYFKHQFDIIHHQNPTMDLFNVAILALLPDDVSDAERRFVEALFITHAETKLNTSGRLLHLTDDDNFYNTNGHTHPITYPLSVEAQVIDREEWCRNLIFPHHRRHRR